MTWMRHRPVVARSHTASVMIRTSSSSSSAGRLRLSVESIHSVTTSTPTSSDQCSSSVILSAPRWWPVDADSPKDRAQRRFPSRITPTCRGIASRGREAASRRS